MIKNSSKYRKVMLVGAIAPALSYNVSSGCLPFGAMALSNFLKQNGLNCEVFSTAFPEAIDGIYSNLDNFDLLGISSMSGPYLNYAITIAQSVRKIRPDIPIVWGGPHASLMDEDLITKDFVDFVIRGVGEWSLLRLIQSLENRCSFSSVPGLTWQEDGRIKKNEPSVNFSIEELPPLDYSFLSKKYSTILNRQFSYFSSRGCPFNCSYCVSSQIYNRCWYSKSEDKVVSELIESYRAYKFQSVFFWDDNLFVDVKRLLNILSKLARNNINFSWSAFCRVDIFSRLNNEIIEELKERGMKWLSFGVESGSQQVLNRLNKGITIDDIKQTALKLKICEIKADFSFMGGIPGETIDDFYKTLDLLKWVKRNNRHISVRVFRFIPYPKMPILNDNKLIDTFLPKDVYQWSEVSYQNKRFPWVSRKISRALTVLSPASLYSEKPKGLSIINIVTTLLFYIVNFRIKYNFFYLPLEGWIVEKIYLKLSLTILNNFKDKIKRVIVKRVAI